MPHRKSKLIDINRGDRYGGRERSVCAWREGLERQTETEERHR